MKIYIFFFLSLILVTDEYHNFTNTGFFEYSCVSRRALKESLWKSWNVSFVEHQAENIEGCHDYCQAHDYSFYHVPGAFVKNCYCFYFKGFKAHLSRFGLRISHLEPTDWETYDCGEENYMLSCKIDDKQNFCKKLDDGLKENWKDLTGLTYDENFYPKCLKKSDIPGWNEIDELDELDDYYIANRIIECDERDKDYTIALHNRTYCGDFNLFSEKYSVQDNCERCTTRRSDHELGTCGKSNNDSFVSVYCSPVEGLDSNCQNIRIPAKSPGQEHRLTYFGCFSVKDALLQKGITTKTSGLCFQHCYGNTSSSDPQMIIYMKPTEDSQISCICQDYTLDKNILEISDLSSGCEDTWCPPIPGPCGSNNRTDPKSGYSVYCQYSGNMDLCVDVLSDTSQFYPNSPGNFANLVTTTTEGPTTTTMLPCCPYCCESKVDERGEVWEAACTGDILNKTTYCSDGNAGYALWTCNNREFTPEQPDRTHCTAEWVDTVESMSRNGTSPREVTTEILEHLQTENVTSGTLIRLIKVGFELGTVDDLYSHVETSNQTTSNSVTEDYVQITSYLFHQPIAWKEMETDIQANITFDLITSNELVAYRHLAFQTQFPYIQTSITDEKKQINQFIAAVEKKDALQSTPDWISMEQANWYENIVIDNSNMKTFGVTYDYHMLPKNIIRVDDTVMHGDASKMEINANPAIISFSVNNKSTSLDGDIVKIIFHHINQSRISSNVSCVSWDPVQSLFTAKGCKILEDEGDRDKTVCLCNHLTNFALFFDISNSIDKNMSETEIAILNYMSVALCSTSCVFSLLTFLVLYYSKLPGSPRVSIVKNRSVCLFGLYLFFLVGFDRDQFKVNDSTKDILCSFFAMSLHFFGLATFTWTLLEGIQLNKSLESNTLTDVDHRKYTKLLRYLMGYGAPMLVITFTLALTYISGQGASAYNNLEKYCWLRGDDFIYAFVGPAAIVIAYNFFIFVKSVRVATKARRHHKTSVTGKLMSQLRSWLTLSFLLGTTWALGFLIVDGAPWVAYFFVLLNGSSGIFIFIHSVLNNQIVMTELKIRFGIGKNERLAINKGGRLAAVKSIKRDEKPKVRKRSPRPRVKTESSSSIPSTTSEEERRRPVRPSPRKSPRRIPRKVINNDDGYFTAGPVTSDPQTPDNTSLTSTSSSNSQNQNTILKSPLGYHKDVIGTAKSDIPPPRKNGIMDAGFYDNTSSATSQQPSASDSGRQLTFEDDKSLSVKTDNTTEKDLLASPWKNKPLTLQQQFSIGLDNDHVKTLQGTLNHRHSL